MKNRWQPPRRMPDARTGETIWKKLTPPALNAVTSLSAESRPKAMRLATRTDMGIETATIQARLSTNTSSTMNRSRFFPMMRSAIWNMMSITRMNVMITKENRKGPTCALKTYR